jgi:hypothetical protein
MRDQPLKVRRPASEWFKCGEGCFQLWQKLQVWRWVQPPIVVLLPPNVMRAPPKWWGQPLIVKRYCLQYCWEQIPVMMRVASRSEDIGLRIGALTLHPPTFWPLTTLQPRCYNPSRLWPENVYVHVTIVPKSGRIVCPPTTQWPYKDTVCFAPNNMWHDSVSKISRSSYCTYPKTLGSGL